VNLVPPAKAALALRYDEIPEIVADAVGDASAVIIAYCDAGAFEDTSGEIPVDTSGAPIGIPADVERACIYMAGLLLRDPTGSDQKDWADGNMPPVLRALLAPYRTPTAI